MNQSTILVVEDDANLRDALCDTLTLAGYRVSATEHGQSALDLIAREPVGLLLSDLQMQPMDGYTLLQKAKAMMPDLPVVMMTAYGTVQSAVEAMHQGASDYLLKPFEAEELLQRVQRYISSYDDSGEDMVAHAPGSRELQALARRVAATDATVLINGESGTGKEVLARYLHACSPRAERPFVAINCAAIPESMLEATLFGYEKGAFTGASQAYAGKFEQAHTGTLLLDEISEMDLALQAKLLRVLSESQVLPLGAREPRTVDIRVVSASHRPLAELVQSGQFRQDLLYRLNAAELQLPPLRQRRDLGGMMDRMLADLGSQYSLGEAARAMLLAHPWPGNLRELNNVLRYAVALCGDGPQAGAEAWECVIEPIHLPDSLQAVDVLDAGPSVLQMGSAAALDEAGGAGGCFQPGGAVELEQLLAQCHGNVSEVARQLGVSRSTVHRRIQRLQLGVRCARWSKRPS